MHDAAWTVTLVSLFFFFLFSSWPGSLWATEGGGVPALIKFESLALGSEATGLLSHHTETLPSHYGCHCGLASSIQTHCHMNNHTAVASIC